MKLTPQHKAILKLHQSGNWVCSTAIEFIRDQRKRISELNNGDYKFQSKPCDGRCGKKHNARLYMRRLASTPAAMSDGRYIAYAGALPIHPKEPIIQYFTCCYSFKVFQTHDPKCSSLKVGQQAMNI